LYRRYMVQVMSTPIFRKSLDGTDPAGQQVFNGTATVLVSRLTVDVTSRLVLQIILVAVLTLETVALSQIRLRGLLPRSPCSIASVMALLAGSNSCHSNFISENEERMDQKGFGKSFRKYIFRMGWWDDHENTQVQTTTYGGGGENVKGSRFGIDIGGATRLRFHLKEKR
jgi:hypothetical protein